MLSANKWIITVEYDNDSGDYILPLPPELLAQTGWQSGDVLNWHDNQDGTWTISKKKGLLTSLKKYYTMIVNKFSRNKHGV
jgi:hypothetical protein